MTGWWRRPTVLDATLTIAILLAGAFGGARYHQAFHAAGGQADFLQADFGAAVAMACGRGFVDIRSDVTAEFEQFLSVKRDAFDCAQLPDVPGAPPSFTQGLYRYLMSTVALVWTVRGVAWSALSPLFGLAYGLTLAIAFGLFRLGMGRGIATAMTAALGISAIHLAYLPHLRDYAKAPFLLALMLLMARIAKGPLEPRRTLAYAVAFGAVLGVGFGFRNDLLITIVPWIGVVLLCTPGGRLRNLPLKLAVLALSISIFFLVSRPIFAAYGKGSNTGHVALLGLMDGFDSQLGVGAASYKWGYGYSDSLASNLITSYGARTTGRSVAYLSDEYDRLMFEYIFKIVRNWPADILARAYGAVLAVVEFPFEVGVHISSRVPFGVVDPRLLMAYRWQIAVLELLQGWGAIIVAIALTLMAATSVRLAFSVLILVAYFAGYPALQFSIRHFFHLEFMVWWALGFVLHRAYEEIRHRPSALGFDLPSRRVGARRVLIFAAGTIALVMIPMVALRAYQQPHVRNMLETDYVGAERVPLVIQPEPASEGRTLFRLPGLWSTRDRSLKVNAAYVIAEFSSSKCSGRLLTMTFRYFGRTTATDLSHDVVVKVLPGGGATEVFSPGYFSEDWLQLIGIELPTEDGECLSRISRVADSALPELLLELNLTPHWRDGKLYQTLVAFEFPSDGDGMQATSYSAPSGHPASSLAKAAVVTDAERLAVVGQDIVAAERDGWLIRGHAATEYAYLLQFQPRRLAAGSKVVVEGEIRSGTLTVGILKDSLWAGAVDVTTIGPFIATIAMPDTGAYELVVADSSKPPWIYRHWPVARRFVPTWLGGRSAIDATIVKAGWVPAPQSNGPGAFH